MKKFLLRIMDGTFGVVLRWCVYQAVRPYVWLKHPSTIDGGEDALSCKESGGIILANHDSMMDGPLLTAMAWPHARIRPTAKYSQYMKWYFRWAMVVFSVIRLGSPKDWSLEQREAEKQRGLETMSKVIANGWLLLLFPAGVIRLGEKEVIDARLSGAYTMIERFPNKPVLLLRQRGLHKSENRGFFRRCHVHITLTRIDNVSIEGGPAAFNKRLEDFFNEGTPLLTKQPPASNVRRLFA